MIATSLGFGIKKHRDEAEANSIEPRVVQKIFNSLFNKAKPTKNSGKRQTTKDNAKEPTSKELTTIKPKG